MKAFLHYLIGIVALVGVAGLFIQRWHDGHDRQLAREQQRVHEERLQVAANATRYWQQQATTREQQYRILKARYEHARTLTPVVRRVVDTVYRDSVVVIDSIDYIAKTYADSLFAECDRVVGACDQLQLAKDSVIGQQQVQLFQKDSVFMAFRQTLPTWRERVVTNSKWASVGAITAGVGALLVCK